MAKFTQHWASDYDERIIRLIPGYGTLHEIASCVLAAQLQGVAGEIDVLVAGAGPAGLAAAHALAASGLRVILADDGDETQTGFGFSVGRTPTVLDLARAAAEAAELIAQRLKY